MPVLLEVTDRSGFRELEIGAESFWIGSARSGCEVVFDRPVAIVPTPLEVPCFLFIDESYDLQPVDVVRAGFGFCFFKPPIQVEFGIVLVESFKRRRRGRGRAE